jgi:hypothetical protein
MPEATVAGRRNVAGVAVILTGVILLALAIWPGDPTASAGAVNELGRPVFAWATHGIAGILALGAVFVAQRPAWRAIGRIMLVLAGVSLLVALVVARDFGLRALLSLLLPALVLLSAAPALGPLPPPQQD